MNELLNTYEQLSEKEQNALFRFLLPTNFGGEEGNLDDYCKAISSISCKDGSAGWRLMIGGALNGAVAAFASDEAVGKIFANRSDGDAPVVIAGQTSPRAQVTLQDNQFLLSGKFKFGSGLKQANWVLCGFNDPSNDNHMVAIVPKRKVDVKGGWNTFGLSKTDSLDYEIKSIKISPEFVFLHDADKPLRGSSTFCCGLATVMLAGHIGLAIGLAKQALFDVTQLSNLERRSGKLADRDDFLIDYGRQLATLKAVVALSQSSLKAADNAARSQSFGQEHKDDVRIAAIFATESAKNIVRFVFDYGGMVSASKTSRLNKIFRDMHVASQHLLVNSSQYKPIVNRVIENLNDSRKS